MNLVMFSLTMVFCMFFIGCGKAATTDTVTETKQSGSVGPFTLALSPENAAPVTNVFSADINQDEGAVDYYNPGTTSTQYLVLESFSATASGCNTNSVKVTPVWYSTETSSQPQILLPGNTMLSSIGTRGKLRVIFQGMNGCKHLDFAMVVRKLEIGALQSQIEPRLNGSWDYGAAPALTINLFISSARVGWLEGRGANYTCDTQLYPSNAVETAGGWLVSSGGGMLCRYQFEAADSSYMNLNCYGSNLYGCTVPKNFRFHKH